MPGKENAFRTIFEATEALNARACVVVDPGLKSITPGWAENLLKPVYVEGFDYVAPLYARHKFDGTLTNANFHAAFKARSGTLDPVTHAWASPVDGIYLRQGPGLAPLHALAWTGMDGTLLDAEAVDGQGAGLPVTEMGIERDGFRGRSIVINASMGSEEAGWAGVYLSEVP
jgi:hypothetical protein